MGKSFFTLIPLLLVAACGREPVAPAIDGGPSFNASPRFFPFDFPDIQICTELVDVTGNFGPLRFVFGQLAANFVSIGQNICARLFQIRNVR